MTRLSRITSRARFGAGTSCTTETVVVDKPAEEDEHAGHHRTDTKHPRPPPGVFPASPTRANRAGLLTLVTALPTAWVVRVRASATYTLGDTC